MRDDWPPTQLRYPVSILHGVTGILPQQGPTTVLQTAFSAAWSLGPTPCRQANDLPNCVWRVGTNPKRGELESRKSIIPPSERLLSLFYSTPGYKKHLMRSINQQLGSSWVGWRMNIQQLLHVTTYSPAFPEMTAESLQRCWRRTRMRDVLFWWGRRVDERTTEVLSLELSDAAVFIEGWRGLLRLCLPKEQGGGVTEHLY